MVGLEGLYINPIVLAFFIILVIAIALWSFKLDKTNPIKDFYDMINSGGD